MINVNLLHVLVGMFFYRLNFSQFVKLQARYTQMTYLLSY